MYGCDNWTIKKAEHRRIDAFELWCWRRLLRVPWTARRSIQFILKEISPEYSLEGLMLKLKLQYFGHLMRRADIGKDCDAGKDWRREKGTTEDEMVGWHDLLDGHDFQQTQRVGDGQGGLVCCSPWGKNWLLMHKRGQHPLVCQEVDPQCLQYPHYLCFLFYLWLEHSPLDVYLAHFLTSISFLKYLLNRKDSLTQLQEFMPSFLLTPSYPAFLFSITVLLKIQFALFLNPTHKHTHTPTHTDIHFYS